MSFHQLRDNCACTRDMCIYWPPNHAYGGKQGRYLLEDKDRFCTTFFHIMPIWEFGIEDHTCLRENEFDCCHKNVTMIVRVQDKKTGKDLKVLRYTNCIAKDRRPIHTEEYITKDRRLSTPNTIITMYAQLQPCHHSGGKNGTYDFRSCTELILWWYNNILKPRNIDLKIECGSIYKAMWTDPKKFKAEAEGIYSDSCEMAREGIRLIYKEGIKMSMITDDGWKFLTRQVRHKMEISEELWEKKLNVNRQFDEFLDTLR